LTDFIAIYISKNFQKKIKNLFNVLSHIAPRALAIPIY